MAKSNPQRAKRSPIEPAMSLFDRENLEFLDALRSNIARGSAATPPATGTSQVSPSSEAVCGADRVFDEYRIDDDDESWGMGELNVKIIHRGRIRVSRAQWLQLIDTCSDGLTEGGVRKDFHLNILSHPSNVRLIYVSYRYKQSGDKQRESRRGILVDEAANIRELMMHLAYWFTAQPHAEKNYPVWSKLVDEAMSKIQNSA